MPNGSEGELAPGPRASRWRRALFGIIFQSETPGGRLFDLALIVSILLSVVVVMLDSVEAYHRRYGPTLYAAEWLFTALFTVEYILRLVSVGRPIRYARSFFGIVDLVAIAPTYLSAIYPATYYLITVRVLRVLRIFRILKLARFLGEADVILAALRASARKIIVFLAAVLTLVVITGSLMYMIEGQENGFTSIPISIYWSIVTLTTVGYGDISPKTGLGRLLACVIMITGYGIIAVPTGIVTVELGRAALAATPTGPPRRACPQCGKVGHDEDATYCRICSARL